MTDEETERTIGDERTSGDEETIGRESAAVGQGLIRTGRRKCRRRNGAGSGWNVRSLSDTPDSSSELALLCSSWAESEPLWSSSLATGFAGRLPAFFDELVACAMILYIK